MLYIGHSKDTVPAAAAAHPVSKSTTFMNEK